MSDKVNLEATIFVYKGKDGAIRCEYLEEARKVQYDPAWEHVATLEPRLWVQSHWEEVSRMNRFPISWPG